MEKLRCVGLIRDHNYCGSETNLLAHWQLRAKLGDKDPYKSDFRDVEGFWTTNDRFVTRAEALDIAFNAGQISRKQTRPLLSSDIDRW